LPSSDLFTVERIYPPAWHRLCRWPLPALPRNIWLMSVFAVTIFLGAFLLFQVQPLIARYLLPWFGGGPSVWTTCLFFFQTFLVIGYAYAHALTRFCRPRAQALVHLGLLAAGLASLPVVPSNRWKPTTTDHPAAAILVLLICNLGLPYLALAATSPLLQHWYSRSKSGASPYPLYALSNFGSLLALLTYPVLFEAYLSRKSQALFWESSFVVFAVTCAFCATYILRSRPGTVPSGRPDEERSLAQPQQLSARFRTPIKRKLLWLAWPACASVLLIAITNKLCLDVAVFPLLWVLPLAVYLISFVVAFSGARYYPRRAWLVGLGAALTGLAWALFVGAAWPFWRQVSMYTGGLSVCCIVCHGELFRIRPASAGLTEYYLLMGIGGALGGMFGAVAAPELFTNYYELHWGLFLCGFLVVTSHTSEILRDLLARPATTIGFSGEARSMVTGRTPQRWAGLGLALLWIGFFAVATALWLQSRPSSDSVVYRGRNFYGVLTVLENRADEPTGHHLLLRHGRITHGFQFVHPQLQSLPTTYFGPDSGLGLAFKALPAKGSMASRASPRMISEVP